MKTLLILLTAIAMNAQQLDPSIDRDSLFNTLLQRFDAEKQDEFTREYKSTPHGSELDLLLYIMNQPQEGRKTMEQNLSKNGAHITPLTTLFLAMVPKEHSVLVRFNPTDNLFGIPESIDISIYGPNPDTDAEYLALAPGSTQLQQVLAQLKWTPQRLEALKTAVHKAGCIAIQNGIAACNITFAQNFNEQFNYVVFGSTVPPEMIQSFTQDCNAIQYNSTIVLHYVGGQGTGCFPD